MALNFIILGLVLIAVIQGIRIKKNSKDIEELKKTVNSLSGKQEEK